MRFGLLLLATALPAASFAAPPSKVMQESIKSKLAGQLLDGFSAQYRWPDVRPGVIYCGFVNGKNSIGAYTGFRPFMVIGGDVGRGYAAKDVVFDVDLSGGGTQKFAAEQCIKAGYDIRTIPD